MQCSGSLLNADLDLRSEASKSVGRTVDVVFSPPKPNRSTYLEVGPESSVSGVTNTTDDNTAAAGGISSNAASAQQLKFTDLGNVYSEVKLENGLVNESFEEREIV